ncbi:MAG: DUF924 family protein [Myxococcota bacterium]
MLHADELHAFWFGDLGSDGLSDSEHSERWFRPDPDFDQACRERFGAAVEQALTGDLDGWADAPRSRLALVLLLDQLPRNLFRGDPRAFAGDPAALGWAERSLAEGSDLRLLPIERHFLYLPFMHAEDPGHQERSVDCFSRLVDDAPAAGRPRFEEALRYAREHQDVIRRFGRFPGRNAALSRDSSPEEASYLAESGAFG